MDSTKSVFDFVDYLQFLESCVGPKGTRRGVRSAAAKAIACHSSFLTKVLEGSANLSLEHSLGLSRFFKMSQDEADYFLLLVQVARAGNQELKRYFSTKIEETRLRRLQLKERVSIRKTLSREDQATYYSSWCYAAVHMALTVPSLRTRSAISQYFVLNDDRVNEILNFLISVGLAKESKGIYEIGTSQLHLEGDSPSILKHHTNWRTRAMVSFDQGGILDLHYSGVMTLSRKSAEQLRESLLKAIQESISFVTKSENEEEVYCFAVDWFALGSH